MRLGCLVVISTTTFAAAPLAAQRSLVVRPIGSITKVSASGLLGSVSAVRALPGGGVIVHDLSRRQLLLLDSTFALKVAIADTTVATNRSYNSAVAGLLQYRGDSSLFVDPQPLLMLVIDENGVVARVAAVPRPEDANFMIGGPFGTPGVDARGRFVYRGLLRPNMAGATTGAPDPGQPFRMPEVPDSAPVLRVDLETRATDTVAFIKIPSASISVTSANSGYRTSVKINPMPIVDDWALMPDGRIAVVRGQDYHVDWFDAAGRWISTGKLEYHWERLDDDAKQRVVDSATTEWQREREKLTKLIPGGSSASATPSSRPGRQQFQVPNYVFVTAHELPDYRPAFRQGAARADADGRLWVRTTAPTDAGAIYDVIDANGLLVERIKLPYGRVIAGFRPGIVYMGVQDEQGARLEKANVR